MYMMITLSISITACKQPGGGSALNTQAIKDLPEAVNSIEDLMSLSSTDSSTHVLSYLTESTEGDFKKMVDFINIQKNKNFDKFAQKFECVRNVDHVLFADKLAEMRGYHLYESHVDRLGNKLVGEDYNKLTLEHEVNSGNDANARDKAKNFLQDNFIDGIPAGTVIIGKSKKVNDGSSAHAAIVGDYNDNGTIMIYHNNWFRPESINETCFGFSKENFSDYCNITKSYRAPFMVSAYSLYKRGRPREWMATPWINVKRSSTNPKEISDNGIAVVTPWIDDMNIFNSDYDFEFFVPPNANKEDEIPFPENSRYTSHIFSDFSNDLYLCQTKRTIQDKALFKNKIPNYVTAVTDKNKEKKMEFFIKGQEETDGVLAIFYYKNERREEFIKKPHYHCKKKSEWLAEYTMLSY